MSSLSEGLLWDIRAEPAAADRHPLLPLCVESYRNRSPKSRPTSLSPGTFRWHLDTWRCCEQSRAGYRGLKGPLEVLILVSV